MPMAALFRSFYRRDLLPCVCRNSARRGSITPLASASLSPFSNFHSNESVKHSLAIGGGLIWDGLFSYALSNEVVTSPGRVFCATFPFFFFVRLYTPPECSEGATPPYPFQRAHLSSPTCPPFRFLPIRPFLLPAKRTQSAQRLLCF